MKHVRTLSLVIRAIAFWTALGMTCSVLVSMYSFAHAAHIQGEAVPFGIGVAMFSRRLVFLALQLVFLAVVAGLSSPIARLMLRGSARSPQADAGAVCIGALGMFIFLQSAWPGLMRIPNMLLLMQGVPAPPTFPLMAQGLKILAWLVTAFAMIGFTRTIASFVVPARNKEIADRPSAF
ncbi:MAG TPA: hypothetical protein PLO62_09065 [Candidatus Hydrogenedentes bacterium]|nr:hypothetical protein [Candidatus Hydrogenedentota bacterium]HOS03470.1 hypothetical protein [Candidatus Hydrogenedentota bacterium]